MQQVDVHLSERSYPIWIGSGELAEMLARSGGELSNWSHAVIIADANVTSNIAEPVKVLLEGQGKRVTTITIPSGESSKSVASIAGLWEKLCAAKSDRKSVVFAIGGGVVGDLAGFAAASYMRGLRFVQVPTTLLAMVDSSVGGKTGINLPDAKNMVGAFWQPQAVWIDTNTLHTLPDREFRSGLAEVVKYGVILDSDFFVYLEQNANAILNKQLEQLQFMIRRSCELKAQVVTQDERETKGLRAILNYGHTFGHAIEAKTAYGQFLHGEAISIGMTMAGRLAFKLGRWGQDDLNRQTRLLQLLGLPVRFDVMSASELIDAMQLDKKTEHGKLNFILPDRIGHVETVSGIFRDVIAESISEDEA